MLNWSSDGAAGSMSNIVVDDDVDTQTVIWRQVLNVSCKYSSPVMLYCSYVAVKHCEQLLYTSDSPPQVSFSNSA